MVWTVWTIWTIWTVWTISDVHFVHIVHTVHTVHTDGQKYAYGFRGRTDHGLRWFGHSGGGPGAEIRKCRHGNKSETFYDCAAEPVLTRGYEPHVKQRL